MESNFRKDFEPVVEAPKNVGLEGKINRIELARPSALKYSLYLITSGATLMLLPMLCYWLPKLKIILTLSKTAISKATLVIVYGEGVLNQKSAKTKSYLFRSHHGNQASPSRRKRIL